MQAETGILPVFVFPGSLEFFSDDPGSHKRVLTLYNPYEFTVKFKVLCTAPDKYSVLDAEGVIKAKCCVDIVIRHRAVCHANLNKADRFRIFVHEHGNRHNFGKKEISATLQAGDSQDDSVSSAQYKQLEGGKQAAGGGGRPVPQLSNPGSSRGGKQEGVQEEKYNVLAILVAVVCVVSLLLPTVPDESCVNSEERRSFIIPDYLHLSVVQKLIFAYTLGLMTMVLFRT